VKNDAARAQRFALELVLRYRRPGQTAWSEGRTENISRSGVLFRADGPLPVDAALELSFVLPVGKAPTGVRCRGRIVRSVPAAGLDLLPGVAVAITDYRLLRAKSAAA
jgi:hypothetical protein